MKKQESFKDAPTIKVHVFWEGHEIWQNLQSLFEIP